MRQLSLSSDFRTLLVQLDQINPPFIYLYTSRFASVSHLFALILDHLLLAHNDTGDVLGILILDHFFPSGLDLHIFRRKHENVIVTSDGSLHSNQSENSPVPNKFGVRPVPEYCCYIATVIKEFDMSSSGRRISLFVLSYLDNEIAIITYADVLDVGELSIERA